METRYCVSVDLVNKNNNVFHYETFEKYRQLLSNGQGLHWRLVAIYDNENISVYDELNWIFRQILNTKLNGVGSLTKPQVSKLLRMFKYIDEYLNQNCSPKDRDRIFENYAYLWLPFPTQNLSIEQSLFYSPKCRACLIENASVDYEAFIHRLSKRVISLPIL